MGGLLPSWDNFDRRGVKTPADVAEHWEKVCQYYQMPINQNIWLDDPLPSSYPPSIAFKAAQLQDTGLAVIFLRRIREMVFLEKKNIIKKEFLHKAAFEVGLDAARLMRDLEGKAQMLFREDLILSDYLEIDELPTLIFTNKEGVNYSIKGYMEYENLEEIIYKLAPNLAKQSYDKSPENLFKVFPTITTKEFAFMRSEEDVESRKILEDLYSKELITRFESFAGNMWKSNFEKLNA
jgi:predicted DsbA family dithiol-disulfide isomerase